MSDDERQNQPVIVEPQIGSIFYVDWVTDAGINEGVINLSLGSIDYLPVHGSTERGRVISAAKLRMSPDFASRLGQLLMLMAADAKKDPDSDDNPPEGEG